MYNKMLDRATRASIVASGNTIEESRRTGRTTGFVLGCISEAMMYPGRLVSLTEPGFTSHIMKRYTANAVIDMINRLELKHMVVSEKNGGWTLLYSLFTPNPWEIK